MSSGVIFYVAKGKSSKGSVQFFYFGFYSKNGCNIFPFLKKKRRKEIIQSIRNTNAYSNKPNC